MRPAPGEAHVAGVEGGVGDLVAARVLDRICHRLLHQFESVHELFTKNVVPSYGRFEIVLNHGAGSYLFDVTGKRYLDLGSGIAVCCLGHAHPAITEALVEQSRKLIHVSNLYFTPTPVL